MLSWHLGALTHMVETRKAPYSLSCQNCLEVHSSLEGHEGYRMLCQVVGVCNFEDGFYSDLTSLDFLIFLLSLSRL